MEKVEGSKEMLEVEGSKEMLEELIKLPVGVGALESFAIKIGAAPAPYQPGRAEYEKLFHNCLDIINLRQQIEQSEVLSKQTFWITMYTVATFVLIVATCLIAIFR